MNSGIIPLLSNSIELANKAIDYSGVLEVNPISASDTFNSYTAITSNRTINNTSIYTFDEELFAEIIQDSTDYLSDLIREGNLAVIDEIRIGNRSIINEVRQLQGKLEILVGNTNENIRQKYIQEAVFDVRANVNSLRVFLDLPSNGNNENQKHLVMSALHSLQVSTDKACSKLREYGLWELERGCYLLGTSALLGGYRIIGYTQKNLQRQLISDISEIQKKILNITAYMLFQQGEEFPWEDAPYLITPMGINRLKTLYSKAVGNQKYINTRGWDAWKIAEVVSKIHNLEILQKMLRDHRYDDKPKKAIVNRIKQLKEKGM